MSMEQVKGGMPYQCQAPQYNAVKIDIHQPKVQTPKYDCYDNEKCHYAPKKHLYGQKDKNGVSMPVPPNVVDVKNEKQINKPLTNEKTKTETKGETKGETKDSVTAAAPNKTNETDSKQTAVQTNEVTNEVKPQEDLQTTNETSQVEGNAANQTAQETEEPQEVIA